MEREVAGEIGRSMHGAGKIADPTPRRKCPRSCTATCSARIRHASSARTRGTGRTGCARWGWRPQHTDLAGSWEKEELPLILEDKTPFHGYVSSRRKVLSE